MDLEGYGHGRLRSSSGDGLDPLRDRVRAGGPTNINMEAPNFKAKPGEATEKIDDISAVVGKNRFG